MTSGIAETDGLGSVDAEGLLLLFLSKVGGSSLGPGTFPLLPILPAAVPVPLLLPISLRNGCWKASSNRCTYAGHLKNNGMTERGIGTTPGSSMAHACMVKELTSGSSMHGHRVVMAVNIVITTPWLGRSRGRQRAAQV